MDSAHGRGCWLLTSEMTLKALAGRPGDFSYSCVAWGCRAEALHLTSQTLRCHTPCLPAQPLVMATFIFCSRLGIPSLAQSACAGPSPCCLVSLGRQTRVKARRGLGAPSPPRTEGRAEAGSPKTFAQAQGVWSEGTPPQVP